MSEEIELNIGGKMVTLSKAPDEIAIRTNRQFLKMDGASLHPVLAKARVGSNPALGGFQVMNVPAESMESDLDELRDSPAVSAGAHVYHTSDDGVPFVPTGEIYVKWKPGASKQEKEDLLRNNKLVLQENRGPNTSILRITSASANPLKVCADLQRSGAAEVAEPDLATPAVLHAALPTDPLLDAQWHLRNTGTNGGSDFALTEGADARVLDAWERAGTFGSPSVIVAVIDDGFDLDHPDLSGPGRQVAPWDFTRNSNEPRPDWYFDSLGRFDGDWHGTACAGVAVGANQGTGIVGAAPGCRLMPIRWGPDLNPAKVEKWFHYVRDQGAAVVSCSWSAAATNYPLPTRTSDAIASCARDGRRGLGTVICFAAGNEDRNINDGADSINGFAIHPDVVAVAASTSMDEKAHYSNHGQEIWITAPSSGSGGRGILTADVRGEVETVRGRFALGYDPSDFTADFGGTSSATPLVAGICGLLLSIRPEAAAQEIKEILRNSARKIGRETNYDESGHSWIFGYGCIDAAAAVREMLGEAEEEAGMDISPAWGKDGHYTTNGKAVTVVPSELAAFYQSHLSQIERESMAADHAKGRDRNERPRHFLDADRYGKHPFKELPEDYKEAVKKFGEKTVIENGILPWAIAERYSKLVEAFASGDEDEILHHSAWLGHYVGDAHVPLHTTENHDGDLTGQGGLHSHFEAGVLKYVDPSEVNPSTGRKLSKPILALAFEWIRESHLDIPAILKADRDTTNSQGRRDLKAFSTRMKPLVIKRLELGATRLASAWYTAWLEAKQPRSSGPERIMVVASVSKPAQRTASRSYRR